MKLTRIDLNSWLLEIAGLRVLIDPWLIDPLVFYGQPWLFSATHLKPPAYNPTTLPNIDLILISQGLDDHCHKPTLEQLARQIPVVGSPTAAKIVQGLGYTDVRSLIPGQTEILDALNITAVTGAPIQGQVENGYFLKDVESGETVYYEPHWFQSEKVTAQFQGTVDVAIAPIIGQVFPLLGQVIMGSTEAMHLIQTLHPRVFVPTSLGEIEARGILPMLIRSIGSVEEFSDRLAASGSKTQLLLPAAGETLAIEPIKL
ncbi:MBL fold metallo-hydrolase [Chroococcidiopsis sp. FACHB-1243]|uniref:MBL fold metallo-hydrolase n=1 Tax=Chroococcidiopsis sp. [FACHB-1243] TaxID=2692781 RepID=UPI00177CBC90|nr:MBL fold metallo-hydrolase [Chroococcidiopsis sp. [FACHB-1243]]MBD2306494.1 MBL fold metallo-hydrolase [Chroococcidiopsis sp. [FACHB-1243]]